MFIYHVYVLYVDKIIGFSGTRYLLVIKCDELEAIYQRPIRDPVSKFSRVEKKLNQFQSSYN